MSKRDSESDQAHQAVSTPSLLFQSHSLRSHTRHTNSRSMPNLAAPKPPGRFGKVGDTVSLAGKHAVSSGWAISTLQGYSSGLSKFIEFKEKTRGGFVEAEPISDEDLYDFIAWAGKTKVELKNGPDRQISLVTIKKYLDGIRAWHIVRHTKRPSTDPEVIKLLLGATERNEEEAELVTKKKPVMIRELFKLLRNTYGKSPEHDLAAAVAIVAFWGMARLGELLRDSAEVGALLRHHVELGEREGKKFVKLHLRKAKTAKRGEIQVIHLQQQFNVLDPVNAIMRLLKSNPKPDRDDLLFAVPGHGGMKAMKKSRFTKILEESWGKSSVGTWSGHSFRVGGTSIRYNLGTNMKYIAKQGRWKSLTYLRYLKAYTEEETADTIAFLSAIEDPSVAELI